MTNSGERKRLGESEKAGEANVIFSAEYSTIVQTITKQSTEFQRRAEAAKAVCHPDE
jgi:hypothetical protein